MPQSHQWRELAFEQLSNHLLYQLLTLRAQIFVVEQNCPYLDPDGLDPQAIHLLALSSPNTLVAALRCIPPGVAYAESSMGRIVVARPSRGTPLGAELINRGIHINNSRWPRSGIRIGAQAALQNYYGKLGFVAQGELYDEDGIDHIEMVFAGTSAYT